MWMTAGALKRCGPCVASSKISDLQTFTVPVNCGLDVRGGGLTMSFRFLMACMLEDGSADKRCISDVPRRVSNLVIGVLWTTAFSATSSIADYALGY